MTNVTYTMADYFEHQRAMARARATSPAVDPRTNSADLSHLPDSMTCAQLAQRFDIMVQVSGRTWNSIIVNEGKGEGRTLGDLRRMSDSALLRIPNVGQVSLTEFRRVFGPPLESTTLRDQLLAERARLQQRLVEIDRAMMEMEKQQ